ncbi:MAG: hypothetical protein ACFCUI_02730 [Bernardetiaceae bacterium]
MKKQLLQLLGAQDAVRQVKEQAIDQLSRIRAELIFWVVRAQAAIFLLIFVHLVIALAINRIWAHYAPESYAWLELMNGFLVVLGFYLLLALLMPRLKKRLVGWLARKGRPEIEKQLDAKLQVLEDQIIQQINIPAPEPSPTPAPTKKQLFLLAGAGVAIAAAAVVLRKKNKDDKPAATTTPNNPWKETAAGLVKEIGIELIRSIRKPR